MYSSGLNHSSALTLNPIEDFETTYNNYFLYRMKTDFFQCSNRFLMIPVKPLEI